MTGLSIIRRFTAYVPELVLVGATVCASAAAPKRVVVLHSFGRGFEPFTTFSETFRTEVGQQLGDH